MGASRGETLERPHLQLSCWSLLLPSRMLVVDFFWSFGQKVFAIERTVVQSCLESKNRDDISLSSDNLTG